MMLNLSREEARIVANTIDAFAVTSPEDEWSPALNEVQAKLWRAIEADAARADRRREAQR